MKTNFQLKVHIPASPSQVYNAWLDSDEHSKMTGGKATAASFEGAGFTAWDNYISGKNLELIPNKKIVQSWRTSEFKETDPDSRLEIQLESSGSGCELTLSHSRIPPNQANYEQGWQDHYFAPMKTYFDSK